jgi:hypothetical protein
MRNILCDELKTSSRWRISYRIVDRTHHIPSHHHHHHNLLRSTRDRPVQCGWSAVRDVCSIQTSLSIQNRSIDRTIDRTTTTINRRQTQQVFFCQKRNTYISNIFFSRSTTLHLSIKLEINQIDAICTSGHCNGRLLPTRSIDRSIVRSFVWDVISNDARAVTDDDSCIMAFFPVVPSQRGHLGDESVIRKVMKERDGTTLKALQYNNNGIFFFQIGMGSRMRLSALASVASNNFTLDR